MRTQGIKRQSSCVVQEVAGALGNNLRCIKKSIVAGAREDYGVVIDSETLCADTAATETLRTAMRTEIEEDDSVDLLPT